jgi:hypothetical protein
MNKLDGSRPFVSLLGLIMLFIDLQVHAQGGGTQTTLEQVNQLTFPLKHYDRDLFTYETKGENAVGATGVTFTIAGNGKATAVVVENLNVRGEGTFKRSSAGDAH